MVFARFLDKLKFAGRVWRERTNIQLLFDTGNYQFLKFAPPGHFYSPIPDIKEADAHSRIVFDRLQTKMPSIDLNIEVQTTLSRELAAYYGDIPFPEKRQSGSRYYLDNEYFSYGDGVVVYSMMRRFKPKRVIEVGSGFSSAAMLDVNEKFFNSAIEFAFIEPFPDRLFSLLRDEDAERCRVLRTQVQEIPENLFSKLHENDILFIDSSHVAKTHSDVVHLLFNILPSLHRGVIVHFHDILWPFEYPSLWFKHGRAWNEAYILRAFLQYNSAFQILYFNSLMEIYHGEFLRREMPWAVKMPSSPVTPGNTSLWIRKTQ